LALYTAVLTAKTYHQLVPAFAIGLSLQLKPPPAHLSIKPPGTLSPLNQHFFFQTINFSCICLLTYIQLLLFTFTACSANALTSLVKMITFPASFNVTNANAESQLSSLVSSTAAIAVGQGLLYSKPLNIMGRLIKPKLRLKNANLLKVSVTRGTTEPSGRAMLVGYGFQVKDVKGITHKLGNNWAYATFVPCSNLIESVYLPRLLTTNQVGSYITTFPRVSNVTTFKAAQAGRRLLEACASAAASGPQTAAGWMVSAVHTVAPYLPFVEYDPTRRSMAEIQSSSAPSTVPLQAASPPPPS
jgi:hypothetical protein